MYKNQSEATKAMNEMMIDKFQGEGREAYLEWVREWRVLYKGLTRIIRQLKAARKRYRYGPGRVKIGDNPHYDPDAAQFARMFKSVANQMMIIREEAKEEARKQRDKRLAERVAA